jgi:hypothetical protein
MIRSALDTLPAGAACEVQTGLVNLHDCARVAALQCVRCGKFMCPQHQVAIDGGLGMQCTECYGLGDDGEAVGDAGAVGSAGAFNAADRKGLAGKDTDRNRDDKQRSGFGDS